MGHSVHEVETRISSFRRKYYQNLLLKGIILSLGFLLAYYLLAAIIEYNLWLGRAERLALFILFFGVVAYCLLRFLREPLVWWLRGKGIGKEDSARIIGSSFPMIQDKLLNFLQLSSKGEENVMIAASLQQKASSFEGIRFESIIDFGSNRKYLKYLIIPAGILVILFGVNQNIFTQSTSRILHFNEEFTPEAPFVFSILNERLIAYPNEDFTLQVALHGETLPEAVYMVTESQRLKLEPIGNGEFTYTFEKIQEDFPFQLEAAGFLSTPWRIELVNRPELLRLQIDLRFPAYTGKSVQKLNNAGNLEVPEGTRITWKVTAAYTKEAHIDFTGTSSHNTMQIVDNQIFEYGKNFFQRDDYSIILDNENSRNKDRISYSVEIIRDLHPSIVVQHLKDSVLYSSILLGGSLEDDYGITRLQLHYTITGKNKEEVKSVIELPVERTQHQQNFFYQWPLDSMHLAAGDHLQYYLEVWDNDGIHGSKSTQSASYQFELPSIEQFKADIQNSQSKTEKDIESSLTKAKTLKESIEQAEQKLKGKQDLEWQDQMMLEDLIKQKKNLDKMVQQLQEENKLLEEKKEAFSQENERIREKAEQIQKLMNELLDEETKKMFEELEKMLRENQDPSQIQKMLEKMDRKEINIEKELERTLELFKGLQYEYKLDQAIQEIKDQALKQEEILDRTEELAGEKKQSQEKKDYQESKGKNEGKESGQNKQKGLEELAKDQEALSQKTDEFKKTIEELDKLGEELDKPEDTPSQEEINQLKETEEQSKKSLEEGQPKNATTPQRKSLEKMKQMQQQLEGMQNSMSMEIDQQNLESLRQIIHGLIKLSFDEEGLMKEFSSIQQIDPKYVQLSQQQLKIQDDAKVLEDSLLALSKRDAFMGSIVTREVGELNMHIDKAVDNIRERRKSNASTDMQLSMTSINNLALMLNDHFDQMMEMMQNAQPSMGKKKQKGPPSLSEMQMKLNQEMEQLKNSGKSGRQLSEELARMAAEQERIRRALSEMQERLKQEGGKPLGNDIPGKMEQTELDLVNKQLTEQTIRRQKDILTRLLESEKSMREQELDEERKGETAKDYQKEMPKAFEEYLRLKEKEVELLKTVPPKLYPYYKREVNEYFKRLGNQK